MCTNFYFLVLVQKRHFLMLQVVGSLILILPISLPIHCFFPQVVLNLPSLNCPQLIYFSISILKHWILNFPFWQIKKWDRAMHQWFSNLLLLLLTIPKISKVSFIFKKMVKPLKNNLIVFHAKYCVLSNLLLNSNFSFHLSLSFGKKLQKIQLLNIFLKKKTFNLFLFSHS